VGRSSTAVAWIVIFLALAWLWVFPGLMFPQPNTNDAIGLTDAEWLILLGIIGGAVGAIAVFHGARGTAVRTALGVFLLGSAAALVVGFLVFGNTSNDRFGQLIYFPPVIALVGLIGLVVGVAASGAHKSELFRGALYGLAAAVIIAVWVLIRGARDWLLAPYGFDILAAILILGGALVMLVASPFVRTAAPPG
jgi:hypothetical protein